MEGEGKQLTVWPVGGFGEIGLNCLMLETPKTAVLIDCGLMFPDDFHYGVDIIIPRLEFILEKKPKLEGIILTHGHEDHIGALPWLLPDLRVPLYSSEFTLALVENKLREYNLPYDLALYPMAAQESFCLGEMRFTFFPVCHSIIQGYGLGIETPVGNIVHTGDFKIDRNPLGGHSTDLEAISKFSESEVLLLFSDSTNIEREGFALTEKEVKLTLEEIFQKASGRILITLFSSHIQRIQEIYELTKQFGRKMAVSGKSLNTNIDIARNLGQLEISESDFCSLEELGRLPDDQIVLLVTGAQGEPMSAMTRLTEGTHRQLRIHVGDTVVMSSRFIPGNTKAINKVINKLYKLGAEVMYEKVQAVHASGHAHLEELKIMLRAVKPKYFIPFHGEFRHLIKHAQLAKDCGVAQERAIVLEDGQPLTFYDHGVRFEEEFSARSVLVDGKGVGDVGRTILRERQLLADEGMVVMILVLDNESGEIMIGPQIQSKGFVFEQQYAHILKGAESIVMDVYEKIPTGSWKKLRDRIKAALRRYFRKSLGRDPVIVPLVITI
ncbi:MAG TPA: ribonuclease J [Desulfohalobiaceae bacterium]|nr:ribonuclease J [Desulfohalobiaceae bacterium]